MIRPKGVLQKFLYRDVPAGCQNSDFHYNYFCPHLPPISIPMSYKKTPNLLKLGAFYDNLLKNTSSLCKLGTCIFDENPHRYTKICEKTPQKAGTYTHTMSMWEPPPTPSDLDRYFTISWHHFPFWKKVMVGAKKVKKCVFGEYTHFYTYWTIVVIVHYFLSARCSLIQKLPLKSSDCFQNITGFCILENQKPQTPIDLLKIVIWDVHQPSLYRSALLSDPFVHLS